MKKRMLKALRDLNAYIDEDREKLCDRLHRYEVSHKRMRRLLFLIDCLVNEDFNNVVDRYIQFNIWRNQFHAVLKAVHDEVKREVL